MHGYVSVWNIQTTVFALVLAFLNFYSSTLETYYTGILHLGALNGPTEIQFMSIAIFLITGWHGPNVWTQVVHSSFSMTWGDIMFYIGTSIGVVTLTSSIARTMRKELPVNTPIHRNPIANMFIHSTMILPLILGIGSWAVFGSDSKAMQDHPVIFFFVLAIAQAHICVSSRCPTVAILDTTHHVQCI